MKCNTKFTHYEDLILHEKQIYKESYIKKSEMFLDKLEVHFIKKNTLLKILKKNK